MDETIANGLPPETFAARLHAACVAGNGGEVKQLLTSRKEAEKAVSLNYSVDAPDIDLYTPLHRAVENGHVQICEQLLEAGADVNVSHPGLDGWTPLHLACWLNATQIAKLLIRAGADATAQDWYANKAGDLGTEDTQKFVANLLAASEDRDTTSTATQDPNAANKPSEWAAQNLVAPCSMTVSKVQADMIAFSIKHCEENDIGGEWKTGAAARTN
ncbi:unnamed protein product [Amoebophrya sp. A120]|nr:unnamed protein product [Amoebophrya sp. A120]|eukprot:GSA120T00003752001.1